jgi:predicted dehydrogenase
MLKVAIVGCGKIADAHAAQIRRIPGCEIVGVCDREELMARQLSDRLHLGRHFSDLTELLDQAAPDVVHITTPPQGHFEIARQCLLRETHVYVEKPFTLNTSDAETLIGLAEKKGLKITAGHDDQFRHGARRMREMVRAGYLGGAPVHMESYYCYEIVENSSYAKALLGDKQHWVRALPGQLLHNIISHGIARIAEFLVTDSPRVIAWGSTSPMLRGMGEDEIIDELRVIISDDNGVTAYFTFSSQMRPTLHQFRIYGSRNGLLLDQDNETLIRLSGARYKSYAEHFLSPVVFAKQYLGESLRNVRSFLGNDFHMKSGLKYLIQAFYQSITDNTALPIPYREILLTSRIMDSIFEQVRLKPSTGGTESGQPERLASTPTAVSRSGHPS